ncbi:hypothetical protein JOC33_003481 [Thalassobacillus pellis]|nr:hypothetical protein [Thalassobacillus pellis]
MELLKKIPIAPIKGRTIITRMDTFSLSSVSPRVSAERPQRYPLPASGATLTVSPWGEVTHSEKDKRHKKVLGKSEYHIRPPSPRFACTNIDRNPPGTLYTSPQHVRLIRQDQSGHVG